MRAFDRHEGKTILTRRSRGLIAVSAAALALAGQLTLDTTRAAVVVDVPESAVVATCAPGAKVDQTPALLAFIGDHDTPGTTFRFKADGCYWINNVIDINNKHDLTFDGNGATFKTIDAGFNTRPSDPRLDRVWPRIRSMWRFEGGYNLTLKNASILGSNGGPNAAIDPRTGQPFRWDFHCPEVEPPHPFCLEAQAGVTLFGVNSEDKGAWGARIDGVRVRYTFGYGIELHGWGAHALNRKIEVRNSKIERVGSMALVAQNVDGAVFENNVLITPRRSMVNIEPPTPGMPSYNVLVNRNLMIDEDDPTDTKQGHFYMFANGGNADARVENIKFSNNQLVNQPVNAYINLGPDLRGRHTTRKNIQIINNVSNIDHGAPFPDQAPIRAIGVAGLEVRGNTQAIQPNQRNYGVSVYGIDGAAEQRRRRHGQPLRQCTGRAVHRSCDTGRAGVQQPGRPEGPGGSAVHDPDTRGHQRSQDRCARQWQRDLRWQVPLGLCATVDHAGRVPDQRRLLLPHPPR